MKKLFAVALAFVLLLSGFAFYKMHRTASDAEGTVAHTDKKTTNVYSFSGSDEVCTVMNGTVIIGEDEEIFSGGKLKINSEEFFDSITSYTATFYVLEDGQRNTVMISSVTDHTGGMVVFDGDDLGKISGSDVINSYSTDNTEAFIDNLYFEISVTDTDGESKSHQLLLDVTKVN